MESQEFEKIDLAKELGLENLPEDQKNKMIAEIGNIIQQQVVLRVTNELSEEDKEEFLQIIKASKDNPENIMMFLNEKVSNLKEIVLEEIDSYKRGLTEFLNEAIK